MKKFQDDDFYVFYIMRIRLIFLARIKLSLQKLEQLISIRRLAVIIIKVPSLHDRLDDIPVLVQHFNKMICREYGIQEKSIQLPA